MIPVFMVLSVVLLFVRSVIAEANDPPMAITIQGVPSEPFEEARRFQFAIVITNTSDAPLTNVEVRAAPGGVAIRRFLLVNPGESVSHSVTTALNDGPSSATLTYYTSAAEVVEEFQDEATITVFNVPPTARFGNDGPILEGETVQVLFWNQHDVSFQDRNAGFLYSYDFDSDGVFEVVDSAEFTATMPAGYSVGIAEQLVTARIKDKDGGFNEYTTTVMIECAAGYYRPNAESACAPLTDAVMLEKSVSSPLATAGDVLIYTVRVNNSSPITLTGATLSDTLPAGLTPISGTTMIEPAVGTAGDVPLIAEEMMIVPSASVTVTYQVNVTGDVIDLLTNSVLLTNTITLSATELITTVAASATVQVLPPPVLEFALKGVVDEYPEYSPVPYTSVITNTSVVTARNIQYFFGTNPFPILTIPELGPGDTWSINSTGNSADGTVFRRFDLYITSAHSTESVTATIQYMSLNVPPTATVGNNGPIVEGETAEIAFADQYDQSFQDRLAGYTYSYDFDSDGVFEIVDSAESTTIMPAVYSEGIAEQPVTARIKDKDGGFSDYTTTVMIECATGFYRPNAESACAPLSDVLTLEKSVSSPLAVAGDILTYTVRVTNSSPISLTGATLSDTLPAGLTPISGTTGIAPAVGTAGNVPLIAADMTIAPSSSVTVTYQVSATGDVIDLLTNSVLLTNTVTLSATEMSATIAASATVTVTEPMFEASVKGIPPTVDEGVFFYWNIVITNTGLIPLENAQVRSSPNANPFYTAPLLQPGESAGTQTLRSRFPDAPSQYTWRYYVSADDVAGFTEASQFMVALNVPPTADLASDGPVREGETAIISFSNQYDPSGADVSVGFRYSYDFDSDGVFEIVDSAESTATMPAIFGTALTMQTVTARIKDKDDGFTDYTTDIEILCPRGTYLSADETACESINDALTLEKSVDNLTPSVGNVVMYTVHISNNSPITLTNATLSDTLPAGLDFVANSTEIAPLGAGIVDDAPLLVADLTVEPGAEITVTYQATVTVGGDLLTNTVALISAEMSEAVTATATVDVPQPATLVMTVTTVISDPVEGERGVYRMTLGNIGDETANGVALRINGGLSAFNLSIPGGATYIRTISQIEYEGPSTRSTRWAVQAPFLTAPIVITTSIDWQNAPPMAHFFSPEPVTAGEEPLIVFADADDPSPQDRAAGFTFSYDFDSDGTYDIVDSTESFVSMPAIYTQEAMSRTVTGRIADRDGGFSVYTTTVDIRPVVVTIEAAGGVVGEDWDTPLVFLLQRTGAASDTLTVRYLITGTASFDDYLIEDGSEVRQVGDEVTFPAGQAYTQLYFTPINDAVVEPDETVVVELLADAGYVVGESSEAVGVILNDDDTAGISAETPILNEGTGGDTAFTFVVTRTGFDSDESILYTVGGFGENSADADDFGGAFPSGEIVMERTYTETVTILVTGDSVVELDETFVITLTTRRRDLTFSTITATATIVNDDDHAPEVVTTLPVSGAVDVSVQPYIEVSFSEPVAFSGNVAVECEGTTQRSRVQMVSDTMLGIALANPLPGGVLCEVTLPAGNVSDVDTMDPPDGLSADYTFSFTTVVANPPAGGSLLVAAVIYQPELPARAVGDGYITIRNYGSTPISLNGYKVGDSETFNDGEGMFRLPNIALDSGAAIVIAEDADNWSFETPPDYSFAPNSVGIPVLIPYNFWSFGTLDLDDNSDEVVLLDGDDQFVDGLLLWADRRRMPV